MEKICVITGGTSGIGKCTAEAMVKKGYTVYELSRREAGNPGMYHIPTDVTDPEACQRAIDAVYSQAGRIDVMINNAGFGISGAIEFTPIEQAKLQLDVNFFGMVNMNHAVIPVMRKQGFGRIVNLSSVAGAIAIPFQAFYSASKAAINSYTMALANEIKPLAWRSAASSRAIFRPGSRRRGRRSSSATISIAAGSHARSRAWKKTRQPV